MNKLSRKRPGSETIQEAEKRFGRLLEEVKLRNDYLKHIATLDIALVVIMASLLQKFLTPETISLFVVSTSLLILSVIAVVASQIVLAKVLSKSVANVKETPVKVGWDYIVSAVAAWVLFILGLSIMGCFIWYGASLVK